MTYDFNVLKTKIRILMERHKPKRVTQSQLAEVLNLPQSGISKKLSPNNTENFSIEQLIALSEFFGVTIDELFDVAHSESSKSELSPRDVCRLLLRMYTSKSPFRFGKVTTEEDCYIRRDNADLYADHEKRINEYTALYFSEWYEMPDDYECDDFLAMEQIGNDNTGNKAINEFLRQIKQVTELYNSGGLPSKEMYNDLLEFYLSKVPDKA